MKVIISGSRGITDTGRLNRAILAAQFDVTHVISGACPNSPDMMGVAWAKRQDPVVPVTLMPADWDSLGKRAGMARNCDMAQEADALIALWDGVSPGTRHMIDEAVARGLHHYIDATCPNCGRGEEVAIYRFIQPAGPLDQIRAMCRGCLVRRGGDISFFDAFGLWGNHALHIAKFKPVKETEVNLPLPPRMEVKGLVFGAKQYRREAKQIKQLPPERKQESLFA